MKTQDPHSIIEDCQSHVALARFGMDNQLQANRHEDTVVSFTHSDLHAPALTYECQF